MEVLDQLFGKKTEEEIVVDTNTQEVEEKAEKNDGEILAPEEAVVEQVSEDENLTTCKKCDFQPENCEQELETTCSDIEVQEVIAKSINITTNDAQSLAREVVSILDSTPSTDFELVNLKSRLYSIMAKYI